MSAANRRYQEKLRARAEGRVPVIVTEPPLPTGVTPEALQARFLAKLARHGKPSPVQESKVEAKAKTEETPAQEPERESASRYQDKGGQKRR
jgi:hypothetical protein